MESRNDSPSSVWERLIEEKANFRPEPVGYWSGGLIVATISLGNIPELIIQVADLSLVQGKIAPSRHAVNGLEIFFENLNINGEQSPCLVLRPKRPGVNQVFFALADHLLTTLLGDLQLPGTAETLESQIKTWIDFWAKEHPEGSKQLLLGLIGELLAIDRWLNLEGLTHSNWTGPEGLPQDFRGEKDGLEVKVLGTRTGPLVHQISSVHQLQDMPDGKLFVLSFRITLASTGSESVHELVERVRGKQIFESAEGQNHLNAALSSTGYSSELPIQLSRFDLVQEHLFEVVQGFPRLVLKDLPSDSRVLDVKYSIDLSAAGEYLIATEPNQLELR